MRPKRKTSNLARLGPFLVAGAVAGAVCGSQLGAPAWASARAAGKDIVLLGNGVGGARFGQAEAVAVATLDRSLGKAKSPVPTSEAGNCDIDAAMQWRLLTAYFDHGRFVGYSTSSTSGRPLLATGIVANGIVTGGGLRLGDTLAEARRIYGNALRTSYAQGGSWFARTADGTLDGYLTAEVGQKSPPPRVASIEAGAVGCPAASP
jgi:hypothetical protein